MINQFLLALWLLYSASFRPARDQISPHDYEYMFGLDAKETLLVDYQYERQNNTIYKDYEIWVAADSLIIDNTWARYKTLNRTSRGLRYTEVSLRYKYDGLSIGYALKRIAGKQTNFIVGGYDISKQFYHYTEDDTLLIDLRINSEISSNFKEVNYALSAQIDFDITKMNQLFIMGKIESVGDIKDWQLKVGGKRKLF